MAIRSIEEYFLVMPIILKKAVPLTNNIILAAVPDHQDQDQVFLCSTEDVSLSQAKKLVSIFPNDPIGIFRCIRVVESTGVCPHVVKTFNEKGELIPTEVFLGR